MHRWACWAAVFLLASAPAARADEAAAAAALHKLGAAITRDETRPGKPVVGVDLSAARPTELDLALRLQNVENSLLFVTRATDADLAPLRELHGLRTLDLYGTEVTDAGLKELEDLEDLQSLNLGWTDVTDAGLGRLRKLHNLRSLDL